jgi:DNA polymerase-3 subunit epsilon
MREECGHVLPGRSQDGYGYAVVDLEATGSSSRRHRVVELAVVLLGADLAPEGEFTTLIDPLGPVGPTHIHGIEPAHVEGAPTFAGVAARLLALLRGRVLVGHNVGCDRAFLVAEYARLGVRLPAVPELCTMRLAAAAAEAAPATGPAAHGGAPGTSAGPGPRPAPAPYGGLSLRACAAGIGLTGWHPHTALGDARATAALLAHHGPHGADLPAVLAAAAALTWPEPPGPSAGTEALWVRRSNVSARRTVPNARHGQA